MEIVYQGGSPARRVPGVPGVFVRDEPKEVENEELARKILALADFNDATPKASKRKG